jgi:anti-anti-sigma factor
MRHTRLRVIGEIDDRAAPRLRTRLQIEIDASEGDLFVDCSGMPFLDSDGLMPILEAEHDLRLRRRRLVLVNLHDAPRRKLELLGLHEYLTGA